MQDETKLRLEKEEKQKLDDKNLDNESSKHD
jgi:hypothetical protein